MVEFIGLGRFGRMLDYRTYRWKTRFTGGQGHRLLGERLTESAFLITSFGDEYRGHSGGRMGYTLIFFTNQPDRAMMSELGLVGGHQCLDSPEEGVVRGLAAYFYDNIILIGPDIPQAEFEAIERDYDWVIRLTAAKTAKDVVWELLNMFPPRNFTVQ